MKTKLIDYYGDTIFFTDQPGRPNTVCFKDMASEILSDKWCNGRKESMQEEKARVITAAAKLIKNELRCTQFDTEYYPSLEDIEMDAEILPPSLKLLMQSLVGSSLKQASIGQCLLKAMKPNSVMPPLLFGLGVEVDHAIVVYCMMSDYTPNIKNKAKHQSY